MESVSGSDTAYSVASEIFVAAQQCAASGPVFEGLEPKIARYAQLCEELRAYINRWAQSIFRGEATLDPEVEKLLQSQTCDLLVGAKQIAAAGRTIAGDSHVMPELDRLHFRIADLDFLLEHWITPRLAVSPAPRVRLTPEQIAQAREILRDLPPLPSDWLPEDPDQRARFLAARSRASS